MKGAGAACPRPFHAFGFGPAYSLTPEAACCVTAFGS